MTCDLPRPFQKCVKMNQNYVFFCIFLIPQFESVQKSPNPSNLLKERKKLPHSKVFKSHFFVSVLLSTHIEKVSVCRMQDFFMIKLNKEFIHKFLIPKWISVLNTWVQISLVQAPCKLLNFTQSRSTGEQEYTSTQEQEYRSTGIHEYRSTGI